MFIFDLNQILDHRAQSIVTPFFLTAGCRIVAARADCFAIVEELS
jgi:hypothetical protein